MTPTAFRGVVVLDTQAQFEQLSTTGTLVIGTETITYQPTSYLYYVKEGGVGVTQQELNEAIADLEAEIPTALSQLTPDSTHRTVTDTEKAAWNLPVVKTGTTAPTSSTVADFVGQFYLDTVTPKTYQCTAISNGVYTWTEVGGGGGGSPIYRHNVTISGEDDNLVMTAHYYSTSLDPFTFQELVSGTTKFEMFDFVSRGAEGTQSRAYGIGKVNTFWYNKMGGGDFEYGVRSGMFYSGGYVSDSLYQIMTWDDSAEDFFIVEDAIYEV